MATKDKVKLACADQKPGTDLEVIMEANQIIFLLITSQQWHPTIHYIFFLFFCEKVYFFSQKSEKSVCPDLPYAPCRQITDQTEKFWTED